jgi:Lipase (class 3)
MNDIRKLLAKIPKVSNIPAELSQQILGRKSLEDFGKKSVRSIVKNSKDTDDAFVSSILSYAVYNKNRWMFDNLGKDFEAMKPNFSKAFFNNNQEEAQEHFFDLKVWNYINNTFEKIKDSSIRIPSQSMQLTDYSYLSQNTYKDGHFDSKHVEQSFDIAHANLIKRKNPNGEGYILHLTYRGTEFDHLWQYIKGPYLDMSAYYENFKPLEKYIKAYVSDPKNQIDELHVAGHSLGGSMVQEFLKNNQKEDFPIPIKGFTFGSPGSKKNVFHKFITTAYHSILRGVDLAIKEQPKKDIRLKEFYHSNDPIPKIGLMGYSKNGDSQDLFDTVREEAQLAKIEQERATGKSFIEKIPVFSSIYIATKHFITSNLLLHYHDNARYIKNIRNFMENYFVAYPDIGNLLSENMKNLHNWNKQERNFISLSVKYKNEFLSMIKEEYPNDDKLALQNKFYQIREKMLIDTTSEAVLAASKHYQGRPDQFFRNKSTEELQATSEINMDLVLTARNSIRGKSHEPTVSYNHKPNKV